MRFQLGCMVFSIVEYLVIWRSILKCIFIHFLAFDLKFILERDYQFLCFPGKNIHFPNIQRWVIYFVKVQEHVVIFQNPAITSGFSGTHDCQLQS